MKKLKAALPAIAILVAIILINVVYIAVIGSSNLPDWLKFWLISR